MEHDWLTRNSEPDSEGPIHSHSSEEWAEIFARTIAHLAAQLTMTQLRLRALATEVANGGAVDPAQVQLRLDTLADEETETYLRENLGEALAEVVDIDSLKEEIATFLRN